MSVSWHDRNFVVVLPVIVASTVGRPNSAKHRVLCCLLQSVVLVFQQHMPAVSPADLAKLAVLAVCVGLFR